MFEQEHIETVARLAQIVYSKLLLANRDKLAYEAFVRSFNKVGLYQLLLVEITIEVALRHGQVYYQANSMHILKLNTHQVEVETWDAALMQYPLSLRRQHV